MYFDGVSVLRDYAAAMDWFRLAAEQGDVDATYALGTMYDNGHGVIQDPVLAHSWFNISAANGQGYGSRERDEIEKSMTHEQIAEALALARRCMASDYQDCDVSSQPWWWPF
jgi:TPR repeat protein